MTQYKPGDLIGRDTIPVFILVSTTGSVDYPNGHIVLYDIREQKSMSIENGQWLLDKLGYKIQK